MSDFDVIVIGAGPAGAAASTLLAKTGARVLLLERSEPGVGRMPESCPAFGAELLDRLGLREVLPQFLAPPAPVRLLLLQAGVHVEIGAHLAPSMGEHAGLRLDRARFDAELVARARSAGVEVRTSTPVLDIVLEAGRVAGVVVNGPEATPLTVRSGVVVDASGKAGFVPRKLGLRREGRTLDERSAYFSHFTGDALRGLVPPGGMTLAPLEDGYLLVTDLGAERFSVFAALSLQREPSVMTPEQRLAFACFAWPELAKALALCERVMPVFPAINSTVTSERLAGPGYAIVGESAEFGDPFFSSGVMSALGSGCLAADCIAPSLARADAWQRSAEHIDYERRCRALLGVDGQVPLTLCEHWVPHSVRRALTDPHLPWPVTALLTRLAAGSEPLARVHRATRATFSQPQVSS